MDLKLFFVLGIMLQILTIECQPELEKVMSRLNAIDTKLTKVNALLAGFEQLCETFHQFKRKDIGSRNEKTISCDEGDDRAGSCVKQEEEILNEKHNVEVINNEKEEPHMLQIASVQSEGITDGIANISVVYIAEKSYVTEWFVSMKNSSGMTSNGLTDEKVRDDGSVEFTSRIILQNFTTVENLILTINSETYIAYLNINISMFTVKGKELLQPIKSNMLLDYKPRVTIPDSILKSEGFKEALTMNKIIEDKINRRNLHQYIEATLEIFNWSVSPPKYTEKWYHPITEFGNMSISMKNGSENELEIKVVNDLAKFGGIIKLYFQQNTDNYQYLQGFGYGVQIKFVNEEIDDIMPHGTFGLRKNYGLRYITGSSFNALCMAFGVPIPNLRIFTKTNDGKKIELEADYTMVLEPSIYKVINYFLNKSSVIDRTIICEASDGNATVTEETQYLPFVKVEIDAYKTRMVKNTTENAVVTCKATGSPVPKLALRAGNEGGRDLIQDGRFRHKFTKKKLANKVTLVIPHRDLNVHSVYCVATQYPNDIVFPIKAAKEIIILPRMPDLDPGFNYTQPVGPSDWN